MARVEDPIPGPENSQIEGVVGDYWTDDRKSQLVDVETLVKSLLDSLDGNNQLLINLEVQIAKVAGENHPEVVSRKTRISNTARFKLELERLYEKYREVIGLPEDF